MVRISSRNSSPHLVAPDGVGKAGNNGSHENAQAMLRRSPHAFDVYDDSFHGLRLDLPIFGLATSMQPYP